VVAEVLLAGASSQMLISTMSDKLPDCGGASWATWLHVSRTDRSHDHPGPYCCHAQWSPAGGPTVSSDHDTISICCITCKVKNGTAISGIGWLWCQVVALRARELGAILQK